MDRMNEVGCCAVKRLQDGGKMIQTFEEALMER